MSEKIYIYPTDTVWGIGANILSAPLKVKINNLKKSDQSKPLSLLFSNIDQLKFYISLSNSYDWAKLFTMETTFVFSKNNLLVQLPEHVLLNSDYVYVRVLALPWIKKICEQEQAPISTTSLNFSGEKPIVSNLDANAFYNKIKDNKEIVFVDEKISLSGNASTIVDMSKSKPKLLRRGARFHEIEKALGLQST